MTHTFKVGDKVRSLPVITNGDEVISELEPGMCEMFVEDMEDLIGKEGIIMSILPDSGYSVKFLSEPFSWNYLPEWLELVDPASPVDHHPV